jgi:hypothetical protein
MLADYRENICFPQHFRENLCLENWTAGCRLWNNLNAKSLDKQEQSPQD